MEKVKISFKLKSIRAEESSIIMMISFGYKEYDSLKEKHIYRPLKYYTGLTAKVADWNKAEKMPNDKKIITALLKLEETVKKVYDYLVLEKKELTPTLLKEEIDYKRKGKNSTTHSDS